ncbi:MAG: hypothetical protein GTO18_16700 [Anaerolineales bacterium]|nr:hypothetical protein [Anaerolineales bacterium]
MPMVFWFSRLQPGVKPEEYEEFIRQVDYPAVKRIDSIIHYQSTRLRGPAMGDEELPYDFIDIAEITDIETYREDLESHPAVEEVHGQVEKYVRSIGNFWAVLVEE